jgi:hypothetical protein
MMGGIGRKKGESENKRFLMGRLLISRRAHISLQAR